MSQPEPGWGALFPGVNAIRSLALAGGTALHAVSVYIAITILPSVVEDIGGLDYYAWNTTLFVAASILGAALAAALAGMVANLGGLLDPGGIEGTASATRWLFGLVALAPLLCLPVALRVGRAGGIRAGAAQRC
ncbi:MAG: hypothetical protein JF625_04845 [Inquilinus limosus]|uniref:Uncharacterized protein n=1 Tax=Inquilinus limosus TaxID=171674 RepID=A0A952FLF0_9PROT|nr:hypothetical protein [Inquilinus limosus]